MYNRQELKEQKLIKDEVLLTLSYNGEGIRSDLFSLKMCVIFKCSNSLTFIFLYQRVTTQKIEKNIKGFFQKWPSKTKVPIMAIFQKSVTCIKKHGILRIHSKFQIPRTIIAPMTRFQRKPIILFGTTVVTLNSVQNYLR